MKIKKNKTPKKRRYLSWIGNIAFVMIIFGLVTAWKTKDLVPSGSLAPNFELNSVDGKKYVLQQFRGKKVVLYFWATWCPVCKTNIPFLNWTYKFGLSGENPNTIFLTILIDKENIHQVKKIIQQKDIQFPVLLGNNELAKKYRISSYPTTYFINKNGNIKSQDSGLITPLGIWWRIFWASSD